MWWPIFYFILGKFQPTVLVAYGRAMVPIWKGLIRMTITACKKGQKCFEWFILTCKICWGQCIREHPWESPDQIIEFFLKFLLLEWKSKKKQIQVYWYKTGWHSVGRYPIWFNSMFEFCQKMVHSIFDSILLYPRFNSKYYSIQKVIQLKKFCWLNSMGNSIQFSGNHWYWSNRIK